MLVLAIVDRLRTSVQTGSGFLGSWFRLVCPVLNCPNQGQPGYQPEGIARLPEETRAARSIANVTLL